MVHQGACINYTRDAQAVCGAEQLLPLVCGVGLAIVKSVRMKDVHDIGRHDGLRCRSIGHPVQSSLVRSCCAGLCEETPVHSPGCLYTPNLGPSLRSLAEKVNRFAACTIAGSSVGKDLLLISRNILEGQTLMSKRWSTAGDTRQLPARGARVLNVFCHLSELI